MRRIDPSAFDQALRPVHRWVWRNPHRRARKLLSFAETEEGGGRSLSRAAELATDPTLRRHFLRHANDELRHASLFRARGGALLRTLPRARAPHEANWLAPGERGLDRLRIDGERIDALLAFLHLSEKAAAQRFALYREVLGHDPTTREVFDAVLEDEVFHMRYTHAELDRVSARTARRRLWQARAGRLWKAYLRVAAALATLMGTILLWVQYFVLLAPFALLARRAARREATGFSRVRIPSQPRSPY